MSNKKKSTIICFTSSFPYGDREVYFENELRYLSQSFDKVILIPSYNPYNNQIRRKVPPNVDVTDVVLRQGGYRILDFILNFRVNVSHFKEFFRRKVYRSPVRFKNWMLSLLAYGTSYKKFIVNKFDPEEVVLYSYWAGQDFFIERKLQPFFKIIRMHGGDFYEERNDGYLPIREAIYQSAALLLPISIDIQRKLMQRYAISSSKIRLSYLGVFNFSSFCALPIGREDKTINVVSCSNLYALKRVHLIYRIIKELDPSTKIKWTHIGSGTLLNVLQDEITRDSRINIVVNFVGQKTQTELKAIYEENYFDLFINTSQYEGLPVSIMEAFSFGIPCVATDVGGTSEIVNKSNGLLIEQDFDPVLIAEQIEAMLASDIINRRVAAFKTWDKLFNAETNYWSLVKDIEKRVLS